MIIFLFNLSGGRGDTRLFRFRFSERFKVSVLVSVVSAASTAYFVSLGVPQSMSDTSAATAGRSSTFTGLPSGIVPYVAILAALVSAAVHLWLTPVVADFDPMQAVLFVLAAVGFIVGIGVFLTRYWRREFYIVAILFALAQIVAYFVLGGPTTPLAIASKTAETVFIVAAAYLYLNGGREDRAVTSSPAD